MADVNQRRSSAQSPPAEHLVARDAPIEPVDSVLVAALVSGEASAAALVWRRYGPMVFGLFERALGQACDAEDLAQDVFLSLFASIHRLRDPAALRSFIYSMAIRRLRWHLRTKRVRSILTLSTSGDLPEREVAGADCEGRELLARFYRLLDHLAANDRTAYTLRYIESLSLAEVASATGASLATVKRRVARACVEVLARVKEDADLLPYLVLFGPTDAR